MDWYGLLQSFWAEKKNKKWCIANRSPYQRRTDVNSLTTPFSSGKAGWRRKREQKKTAYHTSISLLKRRWAYTVHHAIFERESKDETDSKYLQGRRCLSVADGRKKIETFSRDYRRDTMEMLRMVILSVSSASHTHTHTHTHTHRERERGAWSYICNICKQQIHFYQMNLLLLLLLLLLLQITQNTHSLYCWQVSQWIVYECLWWWR